jgi:hypothetical protein
MFLIGRKNETHPRDNQGTGKKRAKNKIATGK